MDPFGNEEIARLLRLKRYEQPPPAYFENFLSEFRRRQRDELLRQPVWRICLARARDFAVQYNVRSLASYAGGIAAAVACAAVISIRIYQQTEHVQVAVESSPVPSRSPNAKKELDFAPPPVPSTFNMGPSLLPEGRHVLPVDPLRFDQSVPLKLEWESLDDQPLLEK